MAGMAGLEPTISESKSGVLPLHYIPEYILRKRPALPAFFVRWGGIWGSNPRHPEPQSGALPTELIPPSMNFTLFSRIQNQSEDFDFAKDEQRSERAFEPARKRDDAKLARTCGTPRGIRTPDLLLRRQLLYPAELLAHKRLTKAQRAPVQAGAGDGNRTHVSSLEGWCSTIELHPHGLFSLEIISYHRAACQPLFLLFCRRSGSFFAQALCAGSEGRPCCQSIFFRNPLTDAV